LGIFQHLLYVVLSLILSQIFW